ncbi:helix-turn-helix domain-containing protein [Streptomyces sp. NPDC088727]|uniref:helix-turn-helix domain-containing protein n=1 Tax=Streptomyces sp. NPDC088727 TaxID=3365875 RepID=UPI00381450C9
MVLTASEIRFPANRLAATPTATSPRGIAAALNVSVRTVYRAFSQGAASPVMGYVRERRLERAGAEPASTRLTVPEIAARRHFANSSHFVKAYKKRFAQTPTAER